ncbi:MAG TPA: tripartite tricarboxylate transporter substrate-binding protein [Xanthobacteraceae bacterium]|nr:tripartite tricarboxylate transporter substrate-binding protein [Xanthobacteraceae bacterium]
MTFSSTSGGASCCITESACTSAPGLVDKLNKEINTALADPKIKARFAELGGTALVGSPSDFGKFIADETEKWAKVIRAANIEIQ